MGFSTTLLFYLLTGAGVGITVWLRDGMESPVQRGTQAVAAILFWPMFLPLLLSGASDAPLTGSRSTATPEPDDAMTRAVRQVEAELESALGSLDDWSDGVLARERGRIEELRVAWRAQAGRVRELDRLLASPGFRDDDDGSKFDDGSGSADEVFERDRVHSTETTRQENIARLRELRQRLRSDLMATLAWVRELVTMIHLARFSGAPASRAAELVTQIAAAVEGLSEVNSWQHGTESDSHRPVPVA